MEPLTETTWDVIISGTGIQQSLLALALSRSDKKILHVDQNEYYGGAEAALSLQETEGWVKNINQKSTPTSNASLLRPQEGSDDESVKDATLSFSRAYNLSLNPSLIYSQSSLLRYLVSSKVYRQLEFQAVGSWWLYQNGELRKVASSREDVFADKSIDLKSKRSLMRFLKFVADYENQEEIWKPYAALPYPEFLTSTFKIPLELQEPLLAIALARDTPKRIETSAALERTATHLRSIGVFGPGFGAVFPKWGGISEIAQVACRACAVGGGVYMLGQGIESISEGAEEDSLLRVQLQNGDTVSSRWVVGQPYDLPASSPSRDSKPTPIGQISSNRSTSIVSSDLPLLFSVSVDGAPPPAAAVIVFPSGSLSIASGESDPADLPPVYIVVHSADSGECPKGQCVLYASSLARPGVDSSLLDQAVQRLLGALESDSTGKVLFTLNYTETDTAGVGGHGAREGEELARILEFPQLSGELALEDEMLERVKVFWQKITHGDSSSTDDFMVFEDREGAQDEEADVL
ncbi:MAG: hypothetical protein M1825_002552 [Sarcosagium campestre]|nr:MAG: hypothetical protein M1825_002552 [Sarcosagium campestre]